MIRSGSLSRRKADSRRTRQRRIRPRSRVRQATFRTRRSVVGQVARQVALGDVVGRPGPEGLHGDLLAAEGRHQDHRDLRVLGPHPLDQLEALHVGHDQVGEDDGGRLARDGRQSLATVGGIDDPDVRHRSEQLADELAVERRVVDHQDRRRLARYALRALATLGATTAVPGVKSLMTWTSRVRPAAATGRPILATSPLVEVVAVLLERHR